MKQTKCQDAHEDFRGTQYCNQDKKHTGDCYSANGTRWTSLRRLIAATS